MAIEPIGSAMVYQAQSVPQISKPVEPVNTEVQKPEGEQTAANFDPTTVQVVNVEQKDSQGNSTNSNANYENQQPASNEQVKQAVEKINKKMGNSEAVFGIHEGTNRVTIKIVDKDTKEVIKELPPEKTLDMIAKMWEMAGILVDEKR